MTAKRATVFFIAPPHRRDQHRTNETNRPWLRGSSTATTPLDAPIEPSVPSPRVGSVIDRTSFVSRDSLPKPRQWPCLVS